MPIPGADLRAQHAALRAELDAAVGRVLASGSFVLGAEVEQFERAFASYCGVSHALGVANGTDALILALRALHVGADDYVALPAFTFAATAEAVVLAGAKPLFVDVDATTMNLDPTALRAAFAGTAKPIRAVIAVHLYGRLAPMTEILAIAGEHGAIVIEDAAQAHGAHNLQGRAGGLGRIGCFSFYPTKNLGAAGDAGAVTTNDAGLAARMTMLRDHGQREKYIHTVVGMNSRLDALQAAVLDVKLPHLDRWNARRRAIADLYRGELAALAALRLPAPAAGDHVYHLFVVRTPRRDELQRHLAACGIASAIHYPRTLPQQRAFAQSDSPGYPQAEAAAAEVLALPCYPELGDDAVLEVCAAIRQWDSRH
ncbi:MAG TPA: DegT/DnrJ/EryC1/StrS family aminotransferase [Terriglobales bacterium]|nr:DegT/DnrJ/EryC1/StrS family aminotransferase [Terriglobales bacterium]